MPITTNIQKRARKSIAPLRPPIVPTPSSNISTEGTVCHLCGYLGRTRSISIEKNGYSFLRHLPPAPGALSVHDNTHHVRACHLCALLLDKQRELNHTSHTFFFKGFFRSTGSCTINNDFSSKISLNPPDESDKEVSIPSPSPQINVTQIQRSLPPPLRKTTSSTTNSSLDLHLTDEMSSLDSFLTSLRSRFLSDYTSIISSKSNSYNTCHLCSSIKPHGTLYTISKNQFEFLSSTQTDVCTLCYYNLMDQFKKQIKMYRRPRPQCYLCHCRIDFIDWEIKLLETEHLPFLLNLSPDKNQFYDDQRLVLTCDQCFYTILFQYIDQERKNIPIQQRTYSWQCTYSYETELFLNNHDVFYITSLSNNKTTI